MGDVPNSNPLYIYDSTAGEQRSYTSHQQLLADETPVPYLCLYAPCTFVSNPQSEFLSLSLPDTMRLSDSESELEAGYEEQLERQEPEYVDFIDLEVEEDDDQVNFVTNLFERPRAEGSNNLCLGLSLGLGDIDEDMYDREEANCDVIPELDLELGLGLGSGSGSGDEFGRRTNCLAGPPNPGEFASVSGQGTSSMEVLRVIDLDSDSESDRNVVYDSRIPSDIVEIDSMESIDYFEQPHMCLEFLGYPQQSYNANGIQFLGYPQQSNGANGIQWQEDELIGGGVYDHHHPNWEFEASSIVIDPLLVEADDILFDWYAGRDHNIPDHISINSDPEYRQIGIFEDPLQDVGVEFLFAVNDLNREFDEDVVEENVNELRGNPPAAISVVETLPVVNLSVEELTENDTCAICWSEFTTKEPLKKLPCHHYYHGDCIVPWLAIRNTCPVCRYQLPTDDLDYEYNRRETEGLDGGGDIIFVDEIVDNYENFRVFF